MLTVRNNWESLEWSFKGKRIEPDSVAGIYVGENFFETKTKRRFKTYNDMGRTYTAVSDDILVKVFLNDTLFVWTSLYENEKILKCVRKIEIIDE